MDELTQRYKQTLKRFSIWRRVRDFFWWRLSHLWCALFGGISQAEKLLLFCWQEERDEVKRSLAAYDIALVDRKEEEENPEKYEKIPTSLQKAEYLMDGETPVVIWDVGVSGAVKEGERLVLYSRLLELGRLGPVEECFAENFSEKFEDMASPAYIYWGVK